MKKRKAILLIGLLAFVLTANLYAGGGRDRVVARQDTLVVAMDRMPINLDPHMTNDIPSNILHDSIFNRLVILDHEMNLVPSLAERWSWDDPTRLRIFLRRGVRFHNGDELRASDVKFSLERSAASPNVSFLTGMIERVDVINDHEVLVVLDFPFVPFLNNLTHSGASIVSERAVRELGEQHAHAPVGTGPFRITNVVQGDRLELVRWENFWGRPAGVGNLTFSIIADPMTRVLAVETGEIDIALGIQPQLLTRVRNHQDLTLHLGNTFQTNYIAFNVTRPPFNDVRVRQAVAYAIDLPAMVSAVYAGLSEPLNGPLTSNVWASINDQLPPLVHNPERARQLLAEAGFPNGFSTTFYTNEGNPFRADTGEIMQNMLRQVGIDVSVRIVEWGAYLELTSRLEAPMFMLGWVPSTGDPDHGLYAPFHSRNIGAAGNRGGYSNPEVDRLLDAGRQETNPQRRAEIYHEIQRIIRAELPWISQATQAQTAAVRNNVKGFELHASSRHWFWDVSLSN